MEQATNPEEQHAPSSLYIKEWKRYCNLRILILLVVASISPVMLAVISFTDESNTSALVTIVVFLTLVGVTYYLCLCWVCWPCPRCKSAFRGRKFIFPVHCQNCGLEKPADLLRW